MAYRQRNLGSYYNTEDIDYQRPGPAFEPPTLQLDQLQENEPQNVYYHSSTELHRYGQNADRYTSNVRTIHSLLLVTILIQ